MRLGIVSNADRAALFTRLLPEHEVSIEPVDASDIRKILVQWRKLNYDLAIIDEGSCTKKEEREELASGTLSFLFTMPPKGAPPLRIIYVASSDRPSNDEVFSRLVQYGAYDFLIPSANDSIEEDLLELIKYPRVYAHVQGYNQNLAPITGSYVAKEEHQPTNMAWHKPAIGPVTVGVVGSYMRVGTTSWAITAAKAVREKGLEVACVFSSEETYRTIRQQHKCEIASNGKSYRIDGVEYFLGATESDVIGKHDYIIFDYGMLNTSYTTDMNSDMNRYEAEFKRCDIKVVINDGSFSGCEYAKNFIEKEDSRDVECWNWGFFGIDDIKLEELKIAFTIKAPNTYAFVVSYYPMPISTGVPVPKEVLTVLGFDQYKTTARAKKGLGLFRRKGNSVDG